MDLITLDIARSLVPPVTFNLLMTVIVTMMTMMMRILQYRKLEVMKMTVEILTRKKSMIKVKAKVKQSRRKRRAFPTFCIPQSPASLQDMERETKCCGFCMTEENFNVLLVTASYFYYNSGYKFKQVCTCVYMHTTPQVICHYLLL